MDADPEYCPFCGATLQPPGSDSADDEDRLLAHLREREDCRERYEDWNPGRTTVELSGSRRRSPLGRVVMWTLMGLAVAYSLLVTQQPLVGVAAALLIYLVFNVEIDR